MLFGWALQKMPGFVESLLRLVGCDWTVRDFSTLLMAIDVDEKRPPAYFCLGMRSK